ncbi:2-aminoethylphosphonate--pyruvate transaminase (plasmid) [Aminobacter sp. NyZ550]|jgi:2-aminoethylphosphonate-pyruvate transaminase|uniref:2-aminoethylphosphonate--pyruvate transaminase n=2 Tax=Aminobacter TaxID=31988 RepID=A0AAC8YV08_AMIAI|nr:MULTISPECIES: 2-aminoethylphosphonate--pyruvate transaminase [Aminobacter]AMS44754.1 2-aminoethylphosphonate--pyruvate aminotransferase [Aminobacter aminovorans]MBA8908092.1 2-aminoethylphosphonate-pyruvate transaminase [Aminobacter ciceronei]MBA9021924.1 2-aminoethylphosphonate-pyruvate transaminase [Aminobacter ciceronei]MBB3704452.1 2-aminoethylphosphonate-pyruvate transaminase [Aminobacter aminovorans]MRX32310.1 2-aminoethylphosphonate--pyruvate transaminase [Aminobacter sp. MDW-2]
MLSEHKLAAQAPFPAPAPLPAPALGEPYLLTPGPLTTSYAVKQAMLRDWGSWDGDFRAMTSEMRQRLLAMLGDTNNEFDCVPMQGSGSFAVEAMLGSFVPRDGKALVLVNGAYGQRIVQTLGYLGRDHVAIDKGDYMPPRGDEVAAALDADPAITHVILVHCETSSGILNPVAEISETVYAKGRKFLVDSMSAFGAIPLEVGDVRYEAMVSSANKCIEGVPGFGFIIARKSELEAAKGRSHSLSLDVHAQWAHMNKTGQWRYTPPTHVVAAFLEALRQHEAEGGVAGRGARYTRNRDVMVAGMRELGFETLLKDRWLSPIIVTFFCPAHPDFAFDRFYELMKEKGFIIYPGKLTVVDSFRVGCIGRMDEHVMRKVVEAAGQSLRQMGVDTAAPPAAAIAERAKLAA